MARRVVALTLDNLDQLPRPCRRCVFWELDPVAAGRAEDSGDPGLEKEAWLSQVLLEWGSCGRLAFIENVPAGYVLYAPPAMVPRSIMFPTSPVSPDAALLMTAHVLPETGGGGVGRMLVQAVAKDLARRGVRAIEAFGDAKWDGPACVLPAQFLLSVGFKTVRPHHRWPRLRMDLRSAVSWREDVEVALDRLLGQLQPLPAT
jgi:GNAT superfamily N-acetyltransferase